MRLNAEDSMDMEYEGTLSLPGRRKNIYREINRIDGLGSPHLDRDREGRVPYSRSIAPRTRTFYIAVVYVDRCTGIAGRPSRPSLSGTGKDRISQSVFRFITIKVSKERSSSSSSSLVSRHRSILKRRSIVIASVSPFADVLTLIEGR